eukprot:3178083-Rhodomonas_salina.1
MPSVLEHDGSRSAGPRCCRRAPRHSRREPDRRTPNVGRSNPRQGQERTTRNANNSGAFSRCARPLHCEVKYKQPTFQYDLYLKCGCLHATLQRKLCVSDIVMHRLSTQLHACSLRLSRTDGGQRPARPKLGDITRKTALFRREKMAVYALGDKIMVDGGKLQA